MRGRSSWPMARWHGLRLKQVAIAKRVWLDCQKPSGEAGRLGRSQSDDERFRAVDGCESGSWLDELRNELKQLAQTNQHAMSNDTPPRRRHDVEGVAVNFGRQELLRTRFRIALRSVSTWAVALLVLALVGCETPQPTPIQPDDSKASSPFALREGDIVKIVFPGAPNLNTTQQVRRDGMIAMENVGEVIAVGKSPAELQKDILKLYETQLLTKEVTVTVESANYPVYVGGAVLRPGKIMATRPMTVLEAIMEAGGFDENRAKSKAVLVTRQEDGVPRFYKLDVQSMLEGKSSIIFYLRPDDVVYVPTKFL